MLNKLEQLDGNTTSTNVYVLSGQDSPWFTGVSHC